MGKSSITFTRGKKWWLERITMDGRQRYPESILVGELGKEREYVQERTCRMRFDDREYRYKCSRCGCLNETYRSTDGKWYTPEYCAHCGARVVGK